MLFNLGTAILRMYGIWCSNILEYILIVLNIFEYSNIFESSNIFENIQIYSNIFEFLSPHTPYTLSIGVPKLNSITNEVEQVDLAELKTTSENQNLLYAGNH